MQSHAIHDGGHAELTHTVVDVTAAVAMLVFHHVAGQVDAQIGRGFGVGQVGTGQVGAAAQQFGDGGGESFQSQLAGLAAGNGFGLGVGCDHRVDHGLVEILGQVPGHAALELRSQFGVGCGVGGELVVPVFFCLVALVFGAPVVVHLCRHDKRCMVPANRGAGEGNFIRAQRFAVGLGGVHAVGAALADVGFAGDECGLVGAVFGGGDGAADSLHIVAIHGDDIPTVGLEASGGVVDEPRRDLAIDGNAVVVIQSDEFVQLPSASQGAGLVADALHHATVTHEHIGVVVDDAVVGAVELGGQEFFGQRHAHRIGDALAQRAGGGFHAGGDAHFGVTGGFAVQLAEIFQLAHRQVVAGEVQQGVNQHGAVAVGQHKAVAVGPMRMLGVVFQVLSPQSHGDIGHAHGRPGVPRVGLLNRVHCQCANRTRHLLVIGHGGSV